MSNPALASELKEELVASLGRWRAQLPDDDESESTGWYGVAGRAIALVGSLLSVTMDTLLPDAELPERPTLGQRIGLIERHGQKMRTTCSTPSTRLVSKADIGVLHRFSKVRNALAHQEEERVDALMLGRYTPARVAQILDAAEAITAMTIVSETICLQAYRAGPARAAEVQSANPEELFTATLIMNADESHCSNCGHGADPTEVRHLTVLAYEGSVEGCHARFVAASSDLEMSPDLRQAIFDRRPDLPILGDLVN